MTHLSAGRGNLDFITMGIILCTFWHLDMFCSDYYALLVEMGRLLVVFHFLLCKWDALLMKLQ